MSVTTINVPINIPTDLYNAGAVDIFARAMDYESQIQDTDVNGNPVTDSNGDPVMIANPQSAEDYGIAKVQEFVREKAKAQMVKETAAAAAAVTAEQTFDTLYNS